MYSYSTHFEVQGLSGDGWSQINIGVGDLISPAGLYASDHDMFAFLVAPDRIDGAGGALMRGIYVRNSEVHRRCFAGWRWEWEAVAGDRTNAQYATREEAQRAIDFLVDARGWYRAELRIVEV